MAEQLGKDIFYDKQYTKSAVANSTYFVGDFPYLSYVEAKETRQETNIKELNERIRKIVARKNELRSEIDKIIVELEDDEI